MNADAWEALGTWVTAAIAAGAAVFAYFQVLEARRTRERVAQPNVVVFIDHNPFSWQHTDLVIKNFGETTAYNVKITLPPYPVVPYVKASDGIQIDTLQLPSHIGILAPGQEWRTVIGSEVERKMLDGEISDNVVVGDVTFTEELLPELTRKFVSKPLKWRRTHRNPVWLDPKLFKKMLRVPPPDQKKS